MNYISTNWLDLSAGSNILTRTYINGFLDISNNIVGRENLWLRNGSNTMFGLGTTDPSNNLHILTNSPDIHFKRENQNALIGKLNFVSPIRNNVASASIRCETDQTSGSLIFATGGDSDNPVDSVIVHSNGNVGIGTNNPYQKLHVNGNIYLGSSDSIETIYSNQKLAFTSNGSINVVADLNDTSGYAGASVHCQINNSTKLMIYNSTKRVAINSSSSPGVKLEVNGSLRTSYQVRLNSAGAGYQTSRSTSNSGWTIYTPEGNNTSHAGGYNSGNWKKNSNLYVSIGTGLWILEAGITCQSNTAVYHNVYTFGISMGTNSEANDLITQQVHDHNNSLMLNTSFGWESAVQRNHITTIYRNTVSNVTIYAGHYILASNSNLRPAGFIRATKVMDLYT